MAIKKVLLLASGSGSIAQAIIDAVHKNELPIELLGLISDKDSMSLQRASDAGIPAFYLPVGKDRQNWDKEIFDLTQSLQPDLVVSVGFMRIMSPDYVTHFRMINTHPTLLPLFPGAHPVRDTLAAGVKETGVTVHWVDEGTDTGPIIAQAKVQILPTDDESTLHERIKVQERELIVSTLHKLIAAEESNV